MIAKRNRRGHLFTDERRADRHAAAEGFPDRDEIGPEAEGREVERIAGPPKTALHFIGDQERSGLGARFANRMGEGSRERPDAPFPLHRFRDDGRRRAGNRRQQRVRIVDRDEADVRQQRRERCAVVLVRGDRQRSECAAVKRFFERDDFRSPFAARVPVASRELQARLHGLGAAVAEKRPRQTRQIGETFAELTLERVVEKVRRVEQRLRLLGDGARESRVGVAERRHAYARQQVEVFAAFGVVETYALAAHERNRCAPVGL